MELRKTSMASELADGTPLAATGAATADGLSVIMMAVSIVATQLTFIPPEYFLKHLSSLQNLKKDQINLSFWEISAPSRKHLLAKQSRLGYTFQDAEVVSLWHCCCGEGTECEWMCSQWWAQHSNPDSIVFSAMTSFVHWRFEKMMESGFVVGSLQR